MRAYHEPARPARRLAALAVATAAVAALVARRRGPRSAAATPAGVGRRAAGGGLPGDRAGEAAGPTRRAGRDPDELRLWVETGGIPVPARPDHTADPLSS